MKLPRVGEDRLREQSVNPNDFWWMASQDGKRSNGIPSHETNEGRPSERFTISRRPDRKKVRTPKFEIILILIFIITVTSLFFIFLYFIMHLKFVAV